MASATNTTEHGTIADKISNAASFVTESVKEYASAGSKEANKEVAKGHTDATLSERASAGFNALGDKIDEHAHGAKAEAHKEVAKH
ncbi:hypothetical protein T439DRAFT_328582 [Meredithblackwellia eburnea MCA 4105]